MGTDKIKTGTAPPLRPLACSIASYKASKVEGLKVSSIHKFMIIPKANKGIVNKLKTVLRVNLKSTFRQIITVNTA